MKKNIFLLLTLFITSLFLSNCGKHEEEGRVAGTFAGAVVGAAVSKKKAQGAVIGGLVGNILGGKYGQEKDEEKRERKVRIERRRLKQENRELRKKLTTKWCSNCSRKVKIRGAQSCPDCGEKLIQEKLCDRCRTTFSPETGYRYCPYCSERIRLKSR